jgi:hypothetical protein
MTCLVQKMVKVMTMIWALESSRHHFLNKPHFISCIVMPCINFAWDYEATGLIHGCLKASSSLVYIYQAGSAIQLGTCLLRILA